MSLSTRRNGFTLIEILIATTLLGIMMLILTSALRVGADSWETGEARLEKANRLYVVETFLKRHVATLFPLTAVNGQGSMEPALQGTATELTYVAALPDQLEGGGLYRFQISLSGEEDNGVIKVLITPYTSTSGATDRPPPAPIDDVVLLDHATFLKLSYFGVLQSQGSSQNINGQPQAVWSDNWHEYQLPILIKMELGRQGEAPWPTLFIAPKTQTLR